MDTIQSFLLDTPFLDIVDKEADLKEFFHWLANPHESPSDVSSNLSAESKQKRSFEEMISDSPVKDEVDLAVKPKSRRFWRRAHPIPRILKRDVRRDFPVMITNVINSGDIPTVGRFFFSHFAHSCQLSSLNKGKVSQRDPSMVRIDGVHLIISMISGFLDATPDFVMRLNESHIRQHIDRAGCQLIISSRIQGTKVKDFLQALAEANKNFVFISNDFNEVVKDGDLKSDGSSDSSSNLCQDMEAYTLDLITVTTYWLDNNNRIYRMEVECDNYKVASPNN
eukprot:scaffold2421_cov171-Ochromonas_danica.AAC.2